MKIRRVFEWRPVKNEKYFFINDRGKVEFRFNDFNKFDIHRFRFFKIFRTKEEALKYLEIRNKFYDELEKLNGSSPFFWLSYEIYQGRIRLVLKKEKLDSHGIWIPYLSAKKLSRLFNEEDVLKYIFGVEEYVDYEEELDEEKFFGI